MDNITLVEHVPKVSLPGVNDRIVKFRKDLISHYSLRLESPLIKKSVYKRTCYFLFGKRYKPALEEEELDKWRTSHVSDDPLCKQMKLDIRNLKQLWGFKNGRNTGI